MQLSRLCHLRCWASGRLLSTVSKSAVESSISELEIPAVTEKDIEKGVMPKKKDDLSNVALAEFLDEPENWGKNDLRPLQRPGRAWSMDELRLKQNSDLHKLWYVLLKERNMLLTMKEAYTQRAKFFPNPERLDRVKESMNNIEAVVHERNDAFLQLETGDSASPPKRSVTSFMGFTFKKQASEHYEPFEVSGEKEYEIPYLDDDAYLMQQMWREKEYMKKDIADYDAYFKKVYDYDQQKFGVSLRKTYDRLEDMPHTVLQYGTEVERRKTMEFTEAPDLDQRLEKLAEVDRKIQELLSSAKDILVGYDKDRQCGKSKIEGVYKRYEENVEAVYSGINEHLIYMERMCVGPEHQGSTFAIQQQTELMSSRMSCLRAALNDVAGQATSYSAKSQQ